MHNWLNSFTHKRLVIGVELKTHSTLTNSSSQNTLPHYIQLADHKTTNSCYTMTIPNTIIAITCTCFAAQTNAFAPASSTISVSRNTLTRRIPTRVQDSFLDDPISLNIPTAMKGSTTETAPDQKYSKVNNRHSSRDWLHNVASIPRSSVLREIMNPVLTISAWSTLVSIIHRGLITSSSPFQNLLAVNMCVPTQVHSFLVSSLGLLLVFRTNSAYQRFVVRQVVN